MMKKAILTVVFVFGMIATIFGQLSSTAQAYKDEAPEVYNPIRANAIEKWDDNHKMITYEINKQVEALNEVLDISSGLVEGSTEKKVLVSAMGKWQEPTGYNWKMVLYEYKKQIKNLDY